jgi:very-short-patch-repair endonuclease
MMKERARELRQNMTLAENRMWYFLRNRRLKGYKFVREYVIDGYIADFACREKKLVIEIDGSQHIDAAEYDQQRTKYLNSLGYKVLRFWNNEVLSNIEIVLNTIVRTIDNEPPENTLIRRCAPPSPQGLMDRHFF